MDIQFLQKEDTFHPTLTTGRNKMDTRSSIFSTMEMANPFS